MARLSTAALILQLSATHPDWSNQQIADEVVRRTPGAKTSAASVSSVKSRAKSPSNVPPAERPQAPPLVTVPEKVEDFELYCGPTAVAALTGRPSLEVLSWIAGAMKCAPGEVEATNRTTLRKALQHLGVENLGPYQAQPIPMSELVQLSIAEQRRYLVLDVAFKTRKLRNARESYSIGNTPQLVPPQFDMSGCWETEGWPLVAEANEDDVGHAMALSAGYVVDTGAYFERSPTHFEEFETQYGALPVAYMEIN